MAQKRGSSVGSQGRRVYGTETAWNDTDAGCWHRSEELSSISVGRRETQPGLKAAEDGELTF